MIIKKFSDTVLLPTKRDVLRLHLYFRLLEHNIRPFENDIDVILELYLFGGYKNSEEQNRFISTCIDKGLRKSAQSLRNTLSKYVSIGIFEKPKNTILYINPKFIPNVDCDKLVLQHTISHAE